MFGVIGNFPPSPDSSWRRRGKRQFWVATKLRIIPHHSATLITHNWYLKSLQIYRGKECAPYCQFEEIIMLIAHVACVNKM